MLIISKQKKRYVCILVAHGMSVLALVFVAPVQLATMCGQSKTLFMGLAVVHRILQRDLSPKLKVRTWMKARFVLYRQ